jgi:hypothetical protein
LLSVLVAISNFSGYERRMTIPGDAPVGSAGLAAPRARARPLSSPATRIDRDALAAVLARAEALARGRDPKADDEALRAFGDVDPTNWTEEAVRALIAQGS